MRKELLMIIISSSQLLIGQTSEGSLTSPLVMTGEQTDKRPIIEFDKQITMADKPFVQMPSEVWGQAIGGAAGQAVASGNSAQQIEGTEGKLVAFMAENKIDLKKIALGCFTKKLSQPNSIVKLADFNGEYIFHIAISRWGLHPSEVFTLTGVLPLLDVKVEIKNKNGTILWKTKESLWWPSKEEVPPHTMEEYGKNPQLLNDNYILQCDMIASTIYDRMTKSKLFVKR